MHTLVDGTNGSDNGTGNEESSLGVSAVTWNSARSVVAVAYAHAEHEDWCDHSTSLAVWNINRRDFDPSKPHQGWIRWASNERKARGCDVMPWPVLREARILPASGHTHRIHATTAMQNCFYTVTPRIVKLYYKITRQQGKLDRGT